MRHDLDSCFHQPLPATRCICVSDEIYLNFYAIPFIDRIHVGGSFLASLLFASDVIRLDSILEASRYAFDITGDAALAPFLPLPNDLCVATFPLESSRYSINDTIDARQRIAKNALKAIRGI